jgi:hypothetical protein
MNVQRNMPMAFAIAFGAMPLLVLAPVPPAMAAEISQALSEKLSPSQRRAYEAYQTLHGQFENQLARYWRAVDGKREARKARRLLGQAFTVDDYVSTQPPKYLGPELPPDVAKIIVQLTPVETPPPLAVVSDFLASAKSQYGFVPTSTTERNFKRSYAREALAVGLTKDHVVRIYALETGGQGTYDMQSGINPMTKQGHPISSALGYAQLLQGNSVDELVRHGDQFVKRLFAMAAAPGIDAQRSAALRQKAAIVQRMLFFARSVPNVWANHVRLGGTPKGLAIHTLNLDADVGPWLQVLKLKGLKEEAGRAGRSQLSGPEIELMNLAGPRTGLEMMLPVAQNMPTSNFFSKGAYYRNTVVREKTAAELLQALGKRIEANLKKPGAVEFAQIFDEVSKP